MWINLLYKYCRTRQQSAHIIPLLLVAIIYLACYLNSFVHCTLINFQAKPKPNFQRRFMWRQMTHTMDDFVDDMMTGARSMLGGMLQPAIGAQQQQQQLGPNEYLSSETTRVKYIIRDPHTNKPMKIIKMGPQKKVIRVLGINNRPLINNNHSNNNNKAHKYHKANKDDYHHNTAVKHMNTNDNNSSNNDKEPNEKPAADDEYDMENNEVEKQVMDEVEKAAEQEHGEGESEIIGGKIHDFDETWQPIEPTDYKKPYANIKSYPMSELHTNVMGALSSSSSSHDYAATHTASNGDGNGNGDGNYHYSSGTHNTEINDVHKANFKEPHMYEVTEYVAEESVALPQSKNFSSRNSNSNSNYDHQPISFRQSHKSTFVNMLPQPTIASTSTTSTIRSHIARIPKNPTIITAKTTTTLPPPITKTSSTATTTTSSNTPEPPNYPAAFLSSFRDVSGGTRKSFPQVAASNYKRVTPIVDNIWLPLNHTLSPLTFRMQSTTKSFTTTTTSSPTPTSTLPSIDRIPILRTPNLRTSTKESHGGTTSTRPIQPRPKQHMINKSSEKFTPLSTSIIATTAKNMRYRGTIKFGDKLNWE